LARAGGDLLLAGCRDTEYSWDTSFQNRPNGAFTYYALKTLKDLPAGASYEKWFAAICDYLPSTRLPQAPQILGSGTRGSSRYSSSARTASQAL
jgi:metacaspase-1